MQSSYEIIGMTPGYSFDIAFSSQAASPACATKVARLILRVSAGRLRRQPYGWKSALWPAADRYMSPPLWPTPGTVIRACA